MQSPAPVQRESDFLECVFVWGITALMVLAALAYVGLYGSSIPFVDDWDYVSEYTAHPLSLDYLWKPHLEHRLPVPKFVMWAVWKSSGGDVRWGMFLTVILLSALAFAMTWVARSVRGRMSYADAFFPLLLLHWGHFHTFIWFANLCNAMLAAVFGALFLLLVDGRWKQHVGWLLLLCVLLLLLPFHSAAGVAYVPALALAGVYFSITRWSSGTAKGKRDALLIGSSSLAAVLLVVLYFYNLPRATTNFRVESTLASKLITALQYSSMSLGAFGGQTWPLSGIVLAIVFLSGFALLAWAWVARPDDRDRTIGLLGCLGGALSLALGIGWSRSQLAGGFMFHYTIFAAPILCCAYFIWGFFSSPAVARFAQMSLFALLCAMSTYHFHVGTEYGKQHREADRAFERDLQAEVPLSELAARHWRYWNWHEDAFTKGLALMRDQNIGRFKLIKADRPSREVVLPATPTTSHQVRVEGETFSGAGKDASLTFALKEPKFVYAIRVAFVIAEQGDKSGNFQLVWKSPGKKESCLDENPIRYPMRLKPGENFKAQTVWVNDCVSAFSIYPGVESFRFRIEKIVLLLPEND